MRSKIGFVVLVISGLAFVGCIGDATHRSGFVTTPTGRIYFEETIERETASRPYVVLLHGGQMDCRMWDDQFWRLAKNYRVVRCDLRGYGKSPQPEQPYFHCEELKALLDHLKIERVSLVGLSLGGSVAIDFALAYPERVEKLVPVASGLSGFDWSGDSFAGWMRIIAAAQAGEADKAADLWLSEPMMVGVNQPPELRARVRRLIAENGPCWLNNPLLERELSPPAAKRLGEIRAPTLAIVGDRDVADILRIAAMIETQVPRARKVVIGGASHIVNMERPEEFNGALEEFLATR